MHKDVVRALQMWLDALSSIDGSNVRDFAKRTGIADGVAEFVLGPSARAPTLLLAPLIHVCHLPGRSEFRVEPKLGLDQSDPLSNC